MSANANNEEISLGDIVAVNHGVYGRKEGLVIGSTVDNYGRQTVEIQFEPGEIYRAWYPEVRRIRRTISYNHNTPVVPKQHRVQKTIYW